MNGNNTNVIAARASEVDVGKLIDHSKLNKVSLMTIILCGAVMVMDGYEFGIMAVVAPAIMQDWGVSPAVFGGVFSAVFIGYFFGALVCGALADRIGRKKVLILTASIFTVASLLIFFSQNVTQLILLRVIAGFGIGGAIPVAITLTSECAPIKGKGKYLSVMYTGNVLGSMLAGYIAGFLLPTFGWRACFIVGFIVPLVVIILVHYFLPESARWLCVKWKTREQRENLITIVKQIDPNIQITEDTVFSTAGTTNQEKHSTKDLFAGKLKWMTPAVWAFYGISNITLLFFLSWGPQLIVMKGYAVSTAAFISGNAMVFGVLAVLGSGFLYDKIGLRRGWIVYTVGGITVCFLGGATENIFIGLYCLSSLLINCAHMAVTILTPNIYPPAIRNQGAGTAFAVARLGAIAGPLIGGFLLATQLEMSLLVTLMIAVPMFIVSVLCYITGRQYDKYFAPLYAGQLEIKK
ncbi:MFS transporter [Sporomusa termitida]|uniref:4-hydroxybenzoate transporter PcaK n=1 Tax=Sporomusa termitida TaxID=2377 RepID=A0A517E1L2_9FIRM|nr:MFS transporter [Sporomusa termitida]QDR83483.1 4-hydroxybenzoate transporter PcaK [Sporomusa termitida]